MDSESRVETGNLSKPATSGELNSWRRGFTPQAEIWNGRMAMFSLAVGLAVFLLSHFLLGV